MVMVFGGGETVSDDKGSVSGGDGKGEGGTQGQGEDG